MMLMMFNVLLKKKIISIYKLVEITLAQTAQKQKLSLVKVVTCEAHSNIYSSEFR